MVGWHTWLALSRLSFDYDAQIEAGEAFALCLGECAKGDDATTVDGDTPRHKGQCTNRMGSALAADAALRRVRVVVGA